MAENNELAVAPSDWVAVPAPQLRMPKKLVALQACEGLGGEDMVGRS